MRLFLLLIFSFCSLWVHGQTFVVSGKIMQTDSKKPIAGVSVLATEIGLGDTSDSLGNYAIRLAKGSYLFEVSHQGYFKKFLRVNANKDLSINFDLDEKANELEEVKISANSANQNLNRVGTGANTLSIKAIKKLPTLLGEMDVIKSLATLPGVSSVGEGSSGINVRGGNIDQNLITMDDAPIYNSSHLMGFFSVFNPDAVRDINFYRGGMPAQFGGRTAAILSVNLKDANAQKLSIQGGVGTISSRLMIETPIIKDKLGFYVAGRLSYADQMLKIYPVKRLAGSKASFNDITSKLEFRPNTKNKISLTLFSGTDAFRLGRDSISTIDQNVNAQYNWQSQNASLSWNRFISSKYSVKTVLFSSQYDADIDNTDSSTAYLLSYQLKNQGFKSIVNGNLSEKNQFDAGIQINHFYIQPGQLRPAFSTSNKNPVTLQTERGLETALFLNDELRLSPKLNMCIGGRYVFYAQISTGAYQNEYNGTGGRTSENLTDSTFFDKNKIMQSYHGFEPRFSLNYTLSASSSIKFSLNRMRQYIQLLSGTTAALPTDRWKLSDAHIRPQTADQLSLGYFKNVTENKFEASVEVFYKKLGNVVDFRDGASLLLNQNPETAILQGKGYSYGAELYIKKNLGLVTGWLSYTYSETRFLIDGATPDERINRGRHFQPIYNRPHIFNVVSTYQMSRRVSLASNLAYSSGRAITYPASKFYVGGVVLPYYNSRNEGRIPNYLRFDFSVNVESNPFKTTGYRSFWSLSFYNLLNRRNAYSVFFRAKNPANQYNTYTPIYKLSVIGSVLPSLTYNFRF